ncbi:hypothetical protein MKW92_046045 [Papaver armeniacum]|nr:hypothetical protein MKW92_046045 [Papaver armeniacum]
MDLNNIGEADDRISELPDSIIYHILSFLEMKDVACTSVLSKRWSHIWTTVPTLVFPDWYEPSEINNFMDFVDRTLLLHDTSSNIQTISISKNEHFNASRVHSWISYVTKRNVKNLSLNLDQTEPFSIPLSLFTCESLVTLELTASPFMDIHLPKSFSLPKLKSLLLSGFQFIGDCWNEQHICCCPVLVNLILDYCTWFGVKKFSISTPALKRLVITHDDIVDDDGLQDCALKIDAPNLVSLTYRGWVAKEYVLSRFRNLESAEVEFCNEYDVPRQQKIGAAVSKFFEALAYVKSLTIFPGTLLAISVVDDFVNILPIFHNLEELFLELEGTTDESVFPLLRAAPNLTRLVFTYYQIGDNVEEDSWDGLKLTAGCLFQHLRYVSFRRFIGNAREMRWLKLILENAKDLQTVTIATYVSSVDAKIKESLMSVFPSLPKGSGRCVLEFR